MTAWIPNVVPDQVIESTWGNSIRDRTVTPFANAAARTTAIPTPKPGQLSWLIDKRRTEIYDGALPGWVPLTGGGPNVAPGSGTQTQMRVRGCPEIRTTDANGNVVIGLGSPVGAVRAFVCTGGDATNGEFYMPYFNQWVANGTTMTILCRNNAGGLIPNSAVRFNWILVDELA